MRTKSLQKARLVGESMLKSFSVLKVDDAVFRGAWRRFKTQKATKYSFTDSTTLELTEQNSIRNIATFDKEFMSSKGLEVVGP